MSDTYICAELVSTEEAANVDKVAVQEPGSVVVGWCTGIGYKHLQHLHNPL